MNHIPTIITLLFVAATLFTLWMFYKASGNSRIVFISIVAWMLFQGIFSLTGFYQVADSMPPRFVLLIGPGLLFTLILFTTRWGRAFVDSLNVRSLTLLHSVRVPVEATLYFVFAAGLIPRLMTFEGNNFDVISGITAPIMYYLVFKRKKLNSTALLIWNLLCLGLLINVLIIAILAASTPFQQFAFDQPNVGVTLFPFVWLPCIIVPIVLISHLSAIRQLVRERTTVSGRLNSPVSVGP